MAEEKQTPLSPEQEKNDFVFDESVCSAEFTVGCTIKAEDQE